MTVELVLKTIGVLVIIKCLVLLLFPAAMINLTRKIIKTKASLRKTAVIYLKMYAKATGNYVQVGDIVLSYTAQ